MYHQVTDSIISELSQIVGAQHTLILQEAMGPYTHDHVTGYNMVQLLTGSEGDPGDRHQDHPASHPPT